MGLEGVGLCLKAASATNQTAFSTPYLVLSTNHREKPFSRLRSIQQGHLAESLYPLLSLTQCLATILPLHPQAALWLQGALAGSRGRCLRLKRKHPGQEERSWIRPEARAVTPLFSILH